MAHSISLSFITKAEQDWSTAFNLLSRIALDIGEDFSQVNVSSIDLEDFPDAGEPDEIEEFHDENTLAKVYNSIRVGILTGSYQIDFPDDLVEEIVKQLQNSGIVFRELKK